MNVLSLFDGMSCGQIALKELGIKVSKYYACEIDKFAIKQTQHNFPDTIQLGNINNWRTWGIDWKSIDLVLAGSPCQGFSFAGKQLAFDDPRSRLFFVFIDILNHVKKLNPDVKFLLENVDMKRSHMKVITDYCGVYPVNINSNLVSAQNRNRWYWTNVKTKRHPVFGDLLADIPQPMDEGILLRDILEKEVDERYYLKSDVLKNLIDHKKRCKEKGYGFGAIFHECNQKMQSIKCGGRGIDDLVCVAMRGRNTENPNSRVSGLPTEQRLEPNVSGKTNCLTSVSKDNLILQRNRGFNKGGLHQEKVPTLSSNSRERNNLLLTDRQKKNYKTAENKANALLGTSYKGSQANGMTLVSDTYLIRRLTPTECARLQTVPDWYEWIVSDTQIYKMCGNGWTVKVIMWILGFLKE
jgi:DNA (cytosine-5)-methyltransferase 3A